jgi:hypothetical protein
MSNSEYLTTRLILRSPKGEEDVARYAQANAWPKEKVVPASNKRGTLRETIWRVSSQVTLHYIVDDVTSSPYIFFSTSWRNIGKGLVGHAQQNLDVYSYRELLTLSDSAEASEERAEALLRLALGSPREKEIDDESFNRIVSALDDDDERVRRAAVYATSYTPSPLYRPYLRRISAEDPVAEIRSDAMNMLGAYDDALIGDE